MSPPPVSTSSDVVRNVVALLLAVGDVAAANDGSGGTARVFHGEEYTADNGSPPRYVFVLGLDAGELGPVLEVGARQVGSITESVSVFVWGAGPSDDARTDDAKARAMRLINCFKMSAPGRLTGKVFSRDQLPAKLRLGEQYLLTFAYSWPVPLDEQIQAAAYAMAPSPALSPANPDQPTGSTGLSFAVTTSTLDNTRP